MRHSVIFRDDGEWDELHTNPENNESEYPPPHGLAEGWSAVQLFDDGALPGEDPDEDHGILEDLLKQSRFRNGRLTSSKRTPRITAVERARMRDGVLEDKTTTGWRRRVIFEPQIDEEGEIVTDEEGVPRGRYFTHGPRKAATDRRGRPVLIRDLRPIDSPGTEDRLVLAGPRAEEAPVSVRKRVSTTAAEWERLARTSKENGSE